MPVNYEIKSQLAKLLAQEDLVVEHRDVETAQFNIESRVLTLPNWKRASEKVYDLLVAHEVGHALYTPNEWDWEGRIPQQFVNVTEDARIEKLMKRRYPGLHKTFNAGYDEFEETDFFCIKDEDLSNMNLADRANLYFKIGNFVDIPIDDGEEMEIIKMISSAETFADAVLAAEELYKYVKGQTKNKKNQEEQPSAKDSSQGSSEKEIEEEVNQDTESAQQQSDDGHTDDDSAGETDDVQPEIEEDHSEPEVSTDAAFNEGAQSLNSSHSVDTTFLEIPKIDMNEMIISNQMIHDELTSCFQEQMVESQYIDSYGQQCTSPPKSFAFPDNEYKKFRKSAQKEVNYLVKEFESKKAADAYSRSSTSRTGVLDCTKLHTYKFNEDLFKKVTIVPDGKNHGLVFVLDWSGSMGDCILDTIKQLYSLIWFCNKVNIPYDVYAFTCSYRYRTQSENVEFTERRVGTFYIDEGTSLMNLLSSNVKKKDVEVQMLNIWRLAFGFRCWVEYDTPKSMALSGTPLNEALVSLHQIIPEFKSKNNVQKVQCIVLTDGEANHLPANNEVTYHGEKTIGARHLRTGDYLRNRKTGFTYEVPNAYYKFTEILLKDLKQSFPDTNFIGIRIVSSREFGSFIRRYGLISENEMKSAKKEKYFDIKKSGYTSLFAIMSSGLNNDTELSVEEGATKAKIKSAFAKNLKNKSLNKKVLSKFMDLVC